MVKAVNGCADKPTACNDGGVSRGTVGAWK
jgi:hypothetical protein